MQVLVLNCGSSSLKYKLVDTDTGTAIKKGKRERLDPNELPKVIAEIIAELNESTIEAVGHRVVHGGDFFHDAALIDKEVTQAIEKCIPLAPLHNPANLSCIKAATEALGDVPHVAVFDTAFHQRLPKRAKMYAIPTDLAEKHGIRRYGFHGPSHQYVADQCSRAMGTPLSELRLITCHLGNGASLAAIELGYCVETSMGMTPLEGLVMGTRSGDIDPGAVLYLQKQTGKSWDEIDHLLNRESGLKGLTGISNDVRDIQERAAEGDHRARLALGVFAHRVRKYIGAYAATMGGVDGIVMTAGIGQNSAQMRRRILQRFEHIGLLLDEDANREADATQGPAPLHAPHSKVKAWVIATDESAMIARETAKIAKGECVVKTPAPIAIAVSGRHAHLTDEIFAKLFGDDAKLTQHKPLSQPGQFASEQKINLIGPRSRIDGVRILGPLRKANQIEISRTDEFKLGVDAPVRPSGKTLGSAPITIEGPLGKIQLSEGLICAWRHIHMTPEDAKSYGVENGDMVEVAISGGPRDLTFGDVKIRVSHKYKTEMHIDTDEANAAEVSSSDQGQLIPAHGLTATLKSRKPAKEQAAELAT